MTPPSPATVFSRYLLTGERIRWTGRPKQGVVFRTSDVFLIPFSLLWGGFAIFWNVGVWAMNAPLDFKLFGLPFIVVGLYLIIGRFLHDALIRRKLYYAVTDQRVLILKLSNLPKLTSLDLGNLPKLDLTEHRGGTGTISFEYAASPFSFTRSAGWNLWIPSLAASQFFRIDRPQEVYRLIRDR